MSIKYTVTNEHEVPTPEEIKLASREHSPIAPESALLITLFVSSWEMDSKEVFRLMKNDYDYNSRTSIASDVAAAYCDENHIKWHSLRILNVNEYSSHFLIEALAIL